MEWSLTEGQKEGNIPLNRHSSIVRRQWQKGDIVSSQKKIDANRQNAQKSTGPKTDAGKAAVAQNAVKHGLTAAAPVIPGEDPIAYNEFRRRLMDELLPKGSMENMLADRIVELSWRLKRSGRLQLGAFDVYTDGNAEPPDTPALGRIAVDDFSDRRVFNRLLMYERRIEHSLYKTMLELQRLQFIRTKYQSLLMDHADYDDWEHREIEQEYQQAYGDKKTENEGS
jgi:hypothetical protein